MEKGNTKMETSKIMLNEKDNLNLSELSIAAIPHDILFPEELNLHLKGQMQFLMHTNGMLQRKISETEEEIEKKTSKISQLSAKISEYERFSKASDLQLASNPSHLMSAKIVELSKKLKDKTVETESLKTKLSKVQQKLVNLENSPPKTDTENIITNELKESESKPDLNEEIKILQEKLSHTNNKLFDMKNNNLSLKNELKTANKILQQELGDNFASIQQFTTNNSNWRGRAQQIIGLQQKNSELLEKLSVLSDKESTVSIPKVDPRKHQIEQLQKEVTSVKNELEDTKRKLNGARARVKVLENECGMMRNKTNTLETKSQNDDKIITLLKNQVSSIEESNNIIRKEKNIGITKVEEENKRIQQELIKEKIVIENLKKIVEEKDNKINELQDEIQYVKIKSPNSNMTLSSPKEISKLNILQVEVNRLLELTTVLNTRLEEERNTHCLTQMNYKKERQRAAKLELKLSRMELENSMNKTHNYSMKSLSKLNGYEEGNIHVTMEILKNNLELAEENISILNRKLNITQKEKELDYQRFSSILSETSSMLLKYNNPQQND